MGCDEQDELQIAVVMKPKKLVVVVVQRKRFGGWWRSKGFVNRSGTF